MAPVDFVKNAESLGATAVRAETLEQLSAALAEARTAAGVRLIYVQVPADVRLPGYSWWDVPVSGTSKVPGVRAARAAYDRAIRRLPSRVHVTRSANFSGRHIVSGPKKRRSATRAHCHLERVLKAPSRE